MSGFIFGVLLLARAGWSAAQRICNNSPDLCSKPYDTITHLGAHDSAFVRNASTSWTSFGNQFYNISTQLDAGVRLLTAQVHANSNDQTRRRELHLCHTSCALFDAGPLKDFLYELRVWLDKNPSDVVTILLVNGDNIDARELEGVYSQADIAHYGYIPQKIDIAPLPSNETNQTWPTLDEMIDKGQRLVSFIAPITPDEDNAPYLLNEWTFIWENYYAVTDASNFTCHPDRPANLTVTTARESGRLFLMNHMLYWQQAFGIQVPDIRNVNKTNSWNFGGALGSHLLDCSSQVLKQPTFVLVDFFNVATDLFKTLPTYTVCNIFSP